MGTPCQLITLQGWYRLTPSDLVIQPTLGREPRTRKRSPLRSNELEFHRRRHHRLSLLPAASPVASPPFLRPLLFPVPLRSLHHLALQLSLTRLTPAAAAAAATPFSRSPSSDLVLASWSTMMKSW